MRAHTERKYEMGKRLAIVIGVAAAGVMALGAQTVLAGGEPDLQLLGKKKQSLEQEAPTHGCFEEGRCPANVQVSVNCGADACTARAKGKLTKVKKDKLKPMRSLRSADLLPGEKHDKLALKLTRKTRKEALRAIDEGKNVEAKVTVRAKDAAGNVATAKRTIKVVK